MQQQDETRFNQFWSAYERMIYRLVHRYARNGYEREELLQESRIVLWQTILDYDPSRGTKFSTLLYTRLVHAMLEWIRNNRYLCVVSQCDFRNRCTGPSWLPIESVLENEEHPAYYEVLNALSYEEPSYDSILSVLSWQRYLRERLNTLQYQCIVCYFGIGTRECTMDEIGRLLNMSRQRVHQHIQRALEILRADPPCWV
jgi:RNA polymerase sigma factor (sigma-70 family)